LIINQLRFFHLFVFPTFSPHMINKSTTLLFIYKEEYNSRRIYR